MGKTALLLTVFTAVVAAERAEAAFVNFESGQVRPLALSHDGTTLYALNTPDNRVEIFDVTAEGLLHTGEVVVGLEPVAVAERTAGEIWVVNHLSDSVSIVDVSDPARPYVEATLLVGDEPRDIVFAGPEGDKAFITTAHRGQNRPGNPQLTTPGVGRADVWVFDARDPSEAPHIITLFSDTPRALAVSPDGTRVYAAAFRSGNQTSVIHELAVTEDDALNAEIGDGFTGLGPPPLPEDLPNTTGKEPPETSIIVRFDGEAWRDAADRDWTPRMRFNLPDKDVFLIDATLDPPAEIGFASGVGTVLFNLAVHPLSGEVYVSNQDARNHIRFEPQVQGYIADTRLTTIDFGETEISGPLVTPIPLNPHIDYTVPTGTAEEVAQSLAIPLGMEFTAAGDRLYLAAFGSGKVAVLDDGGVVLKRIQVGGGPSGLALDEGRQRLYVLNRFDQTISVVDTEAEAESQVVPLGYNPEPQDVQSGRRFLYDAAYSSGHGETACATCHVFGDFDALAWNLGDPGGEIAPNPTMQTEPGAILPLRSFHPMKGPMTTQSLRGLRTSGAMHWRGDRNGGSGGALLSAAASFMKFRPAFESLLGRGEEYPLEDMQAFRAFVLSVNYPPNPIAQLDGSQTPMEAAGEEIFRSDGDRNGLGGEGISCSDCHRGSTGTGGGGVNQPWLSQDFKVPHLRNLYQKVGRFGDARPRIVRSPLETEPVPTPHRGDQIRGFGFRNDGAISTLFGFLRERAQGQQTIDGGGIRLGEPFEPFQFLDQVGRSGDRKARELEAFLLSFDTGLPSHVGQQITLRGDNLEGSLSRFELFRDRGGADLVAHGLLAGERRGLLYDRLSGTFLSDRNGENFTEESLLTAIRDEDAVFTFTVVPRLSGKRMALDRDEDGAFDRDELDRGSDPADPESLPGAVPAFLRGDCNEDGGVDTSDALATLGSLFLGNVDPGCDDACDSNDDGGVDVSDAINTLGVLFLGQGTIPLPGMTECGVDPTDDEVACEAYEGCLK